MIFFKQLYQLLQGKRRLMGFSIGCGILFAGANLLPPLLIRELIEWLTEKGDSHFDLLSISLPLLAVYLFRGATRYGYGRFSHVVAYLVLDDLLVRVYHHLQNLPHGFFNQQRTGDLISRSINDIEAVEDFIAHGIPETILAIVIPFCMMSVLFILNPELALITLLPIPVGTFLVYRYISKVRIMWRSVRERLSELVALVHDNISGIPVIKAFAQEQNRAALVKIRSQKFRESSIAANSVSLFPAAIIEAAGGLGIVLVIWSGGAMALKEHISVANLFVFIVYLGHIYQPFLQLASFNDVLQKAAVSIDRIFQILSVKSDIVDTPGLVAPKHLAWDIQFRNVTFGFDSDSPVIKKINFRMEEGEIVALVGHTGAGKTTIASLLPRFYDPQEGFIFAGGQDIRTLPLMYLRENIASVLQDVFLFHGTINENLRFGRPDASEFEIRDAAQAANAEEFILDLPQGYNSVIGERGVRLSGGQKQRLSIARAILKNAPVLILDEATSSVDIETETLIQDSLSHLTHQRTTLVIAHRLFTVRNANKIVVLTKGRIAEIGDHNTLMTQNGLYARLVNTQNLTNTWSINNFKGKGTD